MFERFTNRARGVMRRTEDEARLLGHNYIDTEHFLLALVYDQGGTAARVLRSLGVEEPAVRDLVDQAVSRGSGAPEGHIPFTPRGKQVLELTLREALQLGCNYLGTEHMLLALFRVGEGVALQVLTQLGVERAAAARQIALLTGRRGTGGAGSQTSSGAPAETEPPEAEPAEAEPARVSFPAGVVVAQLQRISGRLTEIERRLGTDEMAALRAEVARLTALLREHGISADPPPVARQP